jgi:hypothetical protein
MYNHGSILSRPIYGSTAGFESVNDSNINMALKLTRLGANYNGEWLSLILEFCVSRRGFLDLQII